jgi:hypothetical protein
MALPMKTSTISMQYLADLDVYKREKPYRLSQLPGQESLEVSNLEYSIQEDITIYDVRGHGKEFSLSTTSFQFEHSPSQVVMDKSEEADTAYIRETIELVKRLLNPERIVCYDIRVSPSDCSAHLLTLSPETLKCTHDRRAEGIQR